MRALACALVAVALTASVTGCSSGGSGGSGSVPTGDQTPGADASTNPDGGAGASTAQNLNPDGVPYPAPAAGYGTMQRHGKTPGSIIQNFKFLGYPDADESKGLQTIALADYYDPCGKRLKVLHLSVAAVWCEPCNEETAAFVAAKTQLDGEGVVVLQALSDGPQQGVGATTDDLKFWIKEHTSNFTEMLDPDLANLGVFFDAAAVPWNADIDPRTMEIIDDATGYTSSAASEVQPGLTAAGAPPDYPIAVQCN